MFKHTPWREEAKPTEAVLRQKLESEGMSPQAWSNSPGDAYDEHVHDYYKVVYCVQADYNR